MDTEQPSFVSLLCRLLGPRTSVSSSSPRFPHLLRCKSRFPCWELTCLSSLQHSPEGRPQRPSCVRRNEDELHQRAEEDGDQVSQQFWAELAEVLSADQAPGLHARCKYRPLLPLHEGPEATHCSLPVKLEGWDSSRAFGGSRGKLSSGRRQEVRTG